MIILHVMAAIFYRISALRN